VTGSPSGRYHGTAVAGQPRTRGNKHHRHGGDSRQRHDPGQAEIASGTTRSAVPRQRRTTVPALDQHATHQLQPPRRSALVSGGHGNASSSA
jgi:hypothetical protein